MFPKQIGRYEIRSEIGGNERGKVYAAFDPTSNRDIALKMLESQSLFTLTGQKKFTSQMASLQALRHPNLLPIIDFGDEDNRPFIVMPLMSGNLTQRITGSPLPVVETLEWFRGLADGLDFASSNGYAHMDLKPNNVLFDDHGHAFIADLGLVQVIDSLSAARSPSVNPHYVSPEQVRKRPLTIRSQEYSLAALLYHALTGQVLFQGATDLVASFKHTSERPPHIRSLRPDLPEVFELVMNRALEKKPEDRYPSSGDFLQNLVRANGGQITPEEVLSAAAAPPPRPASRPVPAPTNPAIRPPSPQLARALRTRMLIAVAVAIVVCMCGAINFFLAASDF